MEFDIKGPRCYGSGTIGCQRRKATAMIGGQRDGHGSGPESFVDMFVKTLDELEMLRDEINTVLAEAKTATTKPAVPFPNEPARDAETRN